MAESPYHALPPPPGVPVWLQPLVTVTTQVGIPAVFAGVLLWFVLFKVSHTLEKLEEEADTRTRIIAAMQDTLIAALDRQTKEFLYALDRQAEQIRQYPPPPRDRQP